MELDMGAAVPVMSEAKCAKYFPSANFRQANVKLVAYNKTPVDTKIVIDVEMQYNEQRFHLPLVIAKETKEARMPALFGRNWMSKVKVRWYEVMQMKALAKEMPLTEKYRDLFEPGYRAIRGFRASIVVKANASPLFRKA